MRRYLFEIYENGPVEYTAFAEYETQDEVRIAALRTLTDIGREKISEMGDHQVFEIIAREENGDVVYSGSLSFKGTRRITSK